MKQQMMMVSLALALVPGVAGAQTGTETEASRGYVVGRSGLTFGTTTAPLVGAEVGASVGSLVKVYGSFDWHQNVLPENVSDVVNYVGAVVGMDVSATVPSYTVMGGARVQAPRGVVRPYGLGGFGMGHVKGRVEVNGVNMSNVLGMDDDLTFTKPVLEVGGGVVVPAGSTFVDIGYRFRKFLDTGEPFNVSGLYAGFGIRF